ncbi:hypothetical protein [Streptomyces sp. NPDC048361]|uniref:hypothetical protein n=1 Tax=Streptomyces sp. NPDC048361 TaxID=3154720 RepID=UPI00342CE4F4
MRHPLTIAVAQPRCTAYDVSGNALAHAQAVRAADVAGVLHADHEAELHAERARGVAADHGVWAATANFAGPTGGGFDRTSGGSGIWSADGRELARADAAPDSIARARFTG